ncbi:MAG: 23S rRNA (pseudouridine(1915)-N(3))-methyltransferase RlmH [Candidatus Latescibacterota bacterium]|nr:23S rRNA (pseudouridine(1915)-N(3))-methyltransferase RlmH [Candidatus Latescibacterota bacterium]
MFVVGKSFASSEAFAEHLGQPTAERTVPFVVVVGDAEGIPAGVATQVRERWSLSYHELARLLDLEALYRSFDILRGGNYHK